MRSLVRKTLIGGFAVMALLAGTATAEPWNDPNGRVSFEAAPGWVMEVRRASPGTIVLAGSANNECYVMATPNSNTGNANADRVRRATDAIAADAWTAAANAVSPMFPRRSASLTNQSVDTSGFWPIQRAEFGGGPRPVIAGLTSRPGIDLMAFCWTYAGGDATATYEALFRSLSHPNDAQWRASAEQAEAERAARAAPAPASAPAPN
jgi:hypothetical protein